MTVFFTFALLFFTMGVLIFFKVNAESISEMIADVKGSKTSLRKLSVEKKKGKMQIAMEQIMFALVSMGQMNRFYFVVLVSILFVVIGAIVGVSFGSVWLAIAFAVMLAFIPFLFVRYQYIEYKELLMDQMESGLSVITSTIERTENITQSIKENMNEIHAPLLSVFKVFVFSVEHNMSINDAIDNMKNKISSPVFTDWCDTLKLVAENRSTKRALQPISNRITAIKLSANEAKNILREAQGEFIQVSVFAGVFILITYFVIPFFLRQGGFIAPPNVINGFLAVHILIMFFMAMRTFRLVKDIEFDKC